MLDFRKPEHLNSIIQTVRRLLEADKLIIPAEIIKNAQISIEPTDYDNWNNGTTLFWVHINVDIDTFVKIRDEIELYEGVILERVKLVCPRYESEMINTVKISPLADIENNLLGSNGLNTDSLGIKFEEPTFWKPGYFKLFISHLASFKKNTTVLKNTLESYGISCFVAHEDIEPAKEWQQEIERGLFTMDALCALLMPKFKESNWTDQEIGVAIGRNVLVVPIRKGLDPYGFIGKYQGFQAEGKNVGEVALAIFEILSSNNKTSDNLIIKLSELFLLAKTTDEALVRIKALKMVKILSKERVELLRQRITENNNLKSSKVLKEFNELSQRYGLIEIKAVDFEKVKHENVDDLPF